MNFKSVTHHSSLIIIIHSLAQQILIECLYIKCRLHRKFSSQNSLLFNLASLDGHRVAPLWPRCSFYQLLGLELSTVSFCGHYHLFMLVTSFKGIQGCAFSEEQPILNELSLTGTEGQPLCLCPSVWRIIHMETIAFPWLLLPPIQQRVVMFHISSYY